MSILAIARNFDGNPNIVTMVTDNTLAEVTTTGYLLQADIVADIEALQNGEFQWTDTDIILMSYSPDLIGFFVRDALNNTFDSLPPAAGLADTLQDGDIFVGNVGNIATGVTPSGDITLTNAGVFGIAAGVIVNADINAAAAIAYSKMAALISGNILVGSAGNVPTSVAMSGDIAITNTGVTSIQADTIVNADINSAAAISFSKLATLPSAQVLVGSVGNVATATAVTGDVTISNTGVTAIAAGVIVNADVNASAAIDFSKLAALPSTDILVGSAGNVATAVAMTGDVTIGNTGVTAIGANKVLSSMVSPLLLKYTTVAVSAAEFNGMYAAPKLLLAAGGANTLIVLERAVLAMTFVSAAFANGGVVGIQYDGTVHGAGVAASNTEAAADFFAAASTAFQFNGVAGNTVAISPFTTTVNKALYISNLTGAFDTGDNTFVVHLWYRIIPTT